MTDRSESIARLQFLGGQRIEIGSEVVTPEAERLFAMVVRLCVPLGRLVSRQTVMETLWPGADEGNARHNLRQTVYKARELGLVVESGEDGVRLDPQQWSCDWEDPVGDVLGEWLPDYDPMFSVELRSWVTAQRVGVHASLRPRIVKSMQRARASGDLAAADAYARQLLSIDELNEEATMTRAEFMALQGSKVDALRLLDAYSREMGQLSFGKVAGLPVEMLRRRIAEKLPTIAYSARNRHFGKLEGRHAENVILTGALFETRAGRGRAILVCGATGSGKSRLFYEAKRSAILQDVRVIEIDCPDTLHSEQYSTLRTLASKLLDAPGSAGISPAALALLNRWILESSARALPCPIAEFEDLFAAVAEETPFVLQVFYGERMDSGSLAVLDHLYRRGVERQYSMFIASTAYVHEHSAATQLERVFLKPLTTPEVERIVKSYAVEAQPRAKPTHIACAALFSEGIPMYGIEMLGLLLDEGSPDTIPWRVQVAIANRADAISTLQQRALLLSHTLSPLLRLEEIRAALGAKQDEFAASMDALELHGLIGVSDAAVTTSHLVTCEVRKRIGSTTRRVDNLAVARSLAARIGPKLNPEELFAALRAFATSGHEQSASELLDEWAGTLFRSTTSTQLLDQVHRLSAIARSERLTGLLKGIQSRVKDGAEGHGNRDVLSQRHLPTSLPHTAAPVEKTENTFTYEDVFLSAIARARDIQVEPAQRLAEAVSALISADNLNRRDLLSEAYSAVVSVEDSPSIRQFDKARARLIYAATSGDSDGALSAARQVAAESRSCADIRLACQGLRNASSVLSYYGDISEARNLVHESREIAVLHHYPLQVAHADVILADLALHELDTSNASAHIKHAETSLSSLRRGTRMVAADIHCTRCWIALIQGDTAGAAKQYRALVQSLGRGVSGTSRSTMLAARIATFSGTWSSKVLSDIGSVAHDIASRTFMPNEHRAVAALFIATRSRSELEIASNTYETYKARRRRHGHGPWRFVEMLAASSPQP